MKAILINFLLLITLISSSCESELEKKARLQREELEKIELAEKQKKEEQRRAVQDEIDLIAQEKQLEKERLENEIYDKYINNSLSNGSTPFAYCFGTNKSCSSYGCSQITVRTPHNSDVLVTIKRNNEVVRHAYIKAGNSYTFEVAKGIYQTFFYYGKGWNPEKFMKKTGCGELKGGFISDEHFGKDDRQKLNNNILEYKLILQQNGNFSTRPSDQNEAL